MAINRKQRLRYTGAAAGASLRAMVPDRVGQDAASLESIDDPRFRARIIGAETLISIGKSTRGEIPEFTATRGYVARGGSFVNTVFVDSELL